MPEVPSYIGKILFGDKVIGTGFVVHKTGLIATCAHVLQAVDNSPAGKTFVFQPLVKGTPLTAIATDRIDSKCDVALLRLTAPLPKNTRIARLISSSHAKQGTPFQVVGYGRLADVNHSYNFSPATGFVVGTSDRDGIELLQLDSKQILPGMSGAPVIVEDLGGVVGIVSGRYSIDPTKQTFMRDVGWATKSESLIALAPDVLQSLPPIPSRAKVFPSWFRFLFVPMLILPLILALLLVYTLRPKNVPLENAPFNVAIAGFVTDPTSGISDADAKVLSEAFYTNFKTHLESIQSELPLTVGVWSPAQVGIVQGISSAAREKNAESLVKQLKDQQNARADIVVYGIITREGDKVAVIPEFYLSDNWPEISEVFGRFSLNTALAAPGPEQVRALSGELTSRSEVLSYIAEGIVHMILQKYDQAQQAYAQALKVSDQDFGGQELIYILMGNASLGNYNRISAVGTGSEIDRLPVLLEQAESDFEKAVQINPDYSRAYAGLGGILYLRALQPVAAQQAWNEIDDATLDKIQETFQKALKVSDRPDTADIPTKVTFGMGQVYLLRYLRGDQAAWDQATQAFQQIISGYGDGANPRIREFAAQSYGYLGLLRRERSDFEGATSAYQSAVALTQLDSRKDLFKRSLLQVRFTQLRAAGDIDGAAQAVDELLKFKLAPSDAAAILFQKGKMYSEASRKQDAADVFQQALSLDLSTDPILAAQLWVELGDKYYDLGRLADSVNAYKHALKLDPEHQQHLTRVISQTEAEIGTPTPTPAFTGTPVEL